MEHAFSIAEFIAVLCAFTQWLLFDKVIVCSGGLDSECAQTNSESNNNFPFNILDFGGGGGGVKRLDHKTYL